MYIKCVVIFSFTVLQFEVRDGFADTKRDIQNLVRLIRVTNGPVSPAITTRSENRGSYHVSPESPSNNSSSNNHGSNNLYIENDGANGDDEDGMNESVAEITPTTFQIFFSGQSNKTQQNSKGTTLSSIFYKWYASEWHKLAFENNTPIKNLHILVWKTVMHLQRFLPSNTTIRAKPIMNIQQLQQWNAKMSSLSGHVQARLVILCKVSSFIILRT